MRRSVLVLAVLWLAAMNAATAAERVDTPPVLQTIGMWLAANYDLPLAEPPALVTAPAIELVTMRYGAGATISSPEVVAVYDEDVNTIFLAAGWTGRTPAELSVLVHEMVHHLQAAAEMRFACPGEREALAYRAQEAWLRLFGTDLKSTFNIDPATLLVATVCTH
ncbi:DUF6647 family protein [Mesorhizobium sp.]|uniref:DUF6647 family protein n=1 Tax=Mesorhizobium sp. TaxID=1871066 RepID=UPI0025BD833A|nr:DUF6647 family protein [Mesorhizobium sp.]